ncbi:MAG: NADH-quinone oxidoreductase subunit J [Anaerolineae bacterium]
MLYILLALTIFASAAAALLFRSTIRSAIALGIGSAALAMLFFALDAPYAAGFELSVGAGLISVLFVVTISLTRSIEEGSNEA